MIFDRTATGVTYSENARTLTVGITLGATTAADVVAAINSSSAAALFRADLDPTDGTVNGGQGLVAETTATLAPMAAGPKVITGADVNEQETKGVFTALLRLCQAITANDNGAVQRAIGILDDATTSLNYTRAELGARQQGLTDVQDRLNTEDIDLQKSLSDNHDADLVQVVSELAARQAAYKASLQTMGKIMQMSLLDYL